MLKTTHRTLICISGVIWLLVGIFLLSFGIFLVMGMVPKMTQETHFSLIKSFSQWVGSLDSGLVILLALSLFIGHLKGRFVLSKSAGRQIKRILSFPPPVPVTSIYGFGYYLLIGSMIGMGIVLKILPFAQDVRGSIDIAIGSALISGALTFFRFLFLGDK